MKIIKKLIRLSTALWMLLIGANSVSAHCEIPCGIYGDHQRITMIEEHITTVEKSMRMIRELSAEKEINYNQLIRWVDNKELHANKIQDIVFQYFMTQRIAPPQKDDPALKAQYDRELKTLHRLAIAAMKAKQTTDDKYIQQMRTLTRRFAASYFEKEKKTEEKMDHKHE